MSWLRRILGMRDPVTPPHVQAAIDNVADADAAFAEVHEAVRDYRLALAPGKRAEARIMADYIAADEARRGR